MRKVLANEAQPGRTRARLEEKWIGAEEAGVDGGGACGEGVECGHAVVDAR